MSILQTLQLLLIFVIGIAVGRFGTLIQTAYFKKTSEKIREKKQTQPNQTPKPLIEIK